MYICIYIYALYECIFIFTIWEQYNCHLPSFVGISFFYECIYVLAIQEWSCYYYCNLVLFAFG